MYAKCYMNTRCHHKNDISWNASIKRYAEQGLLERLFESYDISLQKGIFLDASTLVSILKSCASTRNFLKGSEVHVEAVRKGLLQTNIAVGSTLVYMYAKCGCPSIAQQVFDSLPNQDVVSWTALISGYSENGCIKKALHYFEKMQSDGISPDAATLVTCLKICSSTQDIAKGSEIHAEVSRKGLVVGNPYIGTTLIYMYTKCGDLMKAQEVFHALPVRNVISWTTLISGYAEHGHGSEALEFFQKMQSECVRPNLVTYMSCLKACISTEAMDKGRDLHVEIERSGLLKGQDSIGNTLLDMYAKCGLLAKAQVVFDKLVNQDLVSWNALIAGYAEHGHGEEALKCFENMKFKGISPDAATFSCTLKACGSVGAIRKGEEIHAEVVKKGLLEVDMVVTNSLVDMYAKCGSLQVAEQVFEKLPKRDVFGWNSLIAGYAKLGASENVFSSLERMLGEGVHPGWMTFIILLNTCSRVGQFNKSDMFFEAMTEHYGIGATVEHHACMVDLLCRTGYLNEAVAMISKMPSYPSISIWNATLNACRNCGNLDLAVEAFEYAKCIS